MTPAPSSRLAFRELNEDDLDDMAALLGDPAVMTFYPRPVIGTRRWNGSTGTNVSTASTGSASG
jgi:RimJ/RimL family protein N-acetyltransferase